MIWPPSKAISTRTRSVSLNRNHLRENAVDGIRVDEGDLEPEEPFTRTLVDEICTCTGEFRECGGKVAHLIGDVVHPRATLRQEAPHRCVLVERLEELDAAAADTHGRRADALIFDRRAVLDLGSEQPLVRLNRLVEVSHGHPEMVDTARVHARDAIQSAT
jgi:hypothetical protein